MLPCVATARDSRAILQTLPLNLLQGNLVVSNCILIPKFKFHQPSHNLPGRKGVATAEDRFTIAFMRVYLEQAKVIHSRSCKTTLAFAREIPVNGYGIADLHVVAWDALSGEKFPDTESFVRVARPCTRAFECKLVDWRKAMSQACRYRFFANQTMVVLPEKACSRAMPYLDTFKKIKVGLWSFSPESEKIRAHHTPRPLSAKSEKYYYQAIEKVSAASRQALPIL